MLRYELMIKKHAAGIAIAICIAASVALAIAFPYTDIEIHHDQEAAYEQN